MILFSEYHVHANTMYLLLKKKILGIVKKYYMHINGLVVSFLLEGKIIFLGQGCQCMV